MKLIELWGLNVHTTVQFIILSGADRELTPPLLLPACRRCRFAFMFSSGFGYLPRDCFSDYYFIIRCVAHCSLHFAAICVHKDGPPINYPDGIAPDIKHYSFMSKGCEKSTMYNADENKFETLGEFKFYLAFSSELSFEYHGIEYGIDKMQDNLFYISDCSNKKYTTPGLTLEEVLDYEIDGTKIRDFIATDEVEITDRPGGI